MREMVSSGIDWVPAIPSEWRVVRAKFVLRKLCRRFEADDTPLVCTNKAEVIVRSENRSGLVSSDEMNYQGVCEGDLLIHGMDTWHGAIAISKLNGKCTTVVHVCDSEQDKRFLCYYYRALSFQGVYKLISNGIRQNTSDFRSFAKFGEIPTLIPPLDEQRLIADYLDERCSAIDEAKKNIEGEIESLRRLRRATIFKAATKGLDNGAPMKASDFSWIAAIPADWSVVPLKSQCTFGKGIQYNKSELTETGYPILSYGQVHSKDNSGISFPNGLVKYARPEAARSYPRSIVGKGEFLFAATSEDAASLGNCIFIDEDVHVLAGTDTIIIKGLINVVPKYLAYQFKTDCWRDQFRKDAVEVKVYHLSTTKLSRTKVILPPLDQQRRIVEFLDERCAAIDSIINARTKQLERLEDYRKALIYAYVTGKKEVPAS